MRKMVTAINTSDQRECPRHDSDQQRPLSNILFELPPKSTVTRPSKQDHKMRSASAHVAIAYFVISGSKTAAEDLAEVPGARCPK